MVCCFLLYLLLFRGLRGPICSSLSVVFDLHEILASAHFELFSLICYDVTCHHLTMIFHSTGNATRLIWQLKRFLPEQFCTYILNENTLDQFPIGVFYQVLI